MSETPSLVTTEWLAARLGEPHIRIADASWYLPQAGRNARAEYESAHIPGATLFDLDQVSDQTTDLPHMLPNPVAIASFMRKLGIGDADTVVFYDGTGIYSAPRARWIMRAMGHDATAVLDGGFPKWQREGRPIQTGLAAAVIRTHFTPRLRQSMIRDLEAMSGNLRVRSEQVVDARSPSRFRGEEAEPRPGVRSGHIPGSVNVHYTRLVTSEGTMRPADELRSIFEGMGVSLERPVVTSCGSGVTAAILSLALELAGAKQTALYDGSWSEWGANPGVPVETGP
jgi:thiosulfate/3-mercaptopyruvate sulfurtransferase